MLAPYRLRCRHGESIETINQHRRVPWAQIQTDFLEAPVEQYCCFVVLWSPPRVTTATMSISISGK